CLLYRSPRLISFLSFHHPPPPAIHTLSYTTLFRSVAALDRLALWAMNFANEVDAIPSAQAKNPDAFRKSLGSVSGPLRRKAYETDRKSTRLNSSHDQISYAVFCLKKKKNKDNNQVC